MWVVEGTAALGIDGLAGPPEAALSVGEYLAGWLAHARGRVRAVTYEGYEVLLRRHALPVLGDLPLTELTPLQVQGLYSSLLVAGPGRAALSGARC